LTEKGRKVLAQIRKEQLDVFKAVKTSLGLSADQNNSFQQFLKHSIHFFDELLDLKLNEPNTLIS